MLRFWHYLVISFVASACMGALSAFGANHWHSPRDKFEQVAFFVAVSPLIAILVWGVDKAFTGRAGPSGRQRDRKGSQDG